MRIAVVLALLASAPACHKLFGLESIADQDAPVDAPPCAPRSITTGRDHSCSVDYLGRVFCWGRNEFGQVVPQGPEYVLEPARIGLPGPAVQVAGGKRATCARLEDATVWCWGDTAEGQLGGGATGTGEGPTKIAIPESAEIRAGGMTMCSRSRDDGAIWCWGANKHRAAGQATDVPCPGNDNCVAPAMVPNTQNSKALAMGHRHACAIDATDRLVCWGRDKDGQLGDGGAAGDQRTEAAGIPTLGAVTAVSAAGRHTCAVDQTGAVQCWGEGYEGQLGTGMTEDSYVPVFSLVTGARSLAMGQNGGCALLVDGTLSCWGNLDAGDGGMGVELAPSKTMLDGVTDVTSSFQHSCAIAHGDVYCWGINSQGELGRGNRAVNLSPIPIGPSMVDMVGVGEDHVCVHTQNGISCWGANTFAQAGSDDLQWRYSPASVTTTLPSIEGLAVGINRSCAWGGGQAQCWGRGASYALGNQQDKRNFGTPQTVAASGVSEIAIGGDFICVRSSGTVTCFGYNGRGQLGTTAGPTPLSKTGNQVNLTNVSKVVAGRGHACALSAGELWCWGYNELGQVGDGTKVDRSAPTPVANIGVVTDVGAGNLFTCALDSASAIYCWGNNSNGNLGDGTRTQHSLPAKVLLPVGRTASRLAVGGDHACAVLDNGNVVCWGDGDQGQIGNGADIDAPTPVPVPAFAGATKLALGLYGTCALMAGGSLQCTGDNRILATGDATASVPALTVRTACQD